MHKRYGFTVIELAVVIVILGLLLGLAVLSLRSSQVYARDNERTADVQTIANYLESKYSQEIRDESGNLIKQAGAYPYFLCMTTYDQVPQEYAPEASQWYELCVDDLSVASSNQHVAMLKHLIDEIGEKPLRSPLERLDISLVTPIEDGSYWLMYDGITHQTSSTIPAVEQLGPDRYFYRAENADRSVCSLSPGQSFKSDCRAFTIYYVLEDSPTELRKIESKRR